MNTVRLKRLVLPLDDTSTFTIMNESIPRWAI
jgi:hypothetical protein